MLFPVCLPKAIAVLATAGTPFSRRWQVLLCEWGQWLQQSSAKRPPDRRQSRWQPGALQIGCSRQGANSGGGLVALGGGGGSHGSSSRERVTPAWA